MINIGFYTEEEYYKFLDDVKDPEQWSSEYSVWLDNFEKSRNELLEAGRMVMPINMILSEFKLWCASKRMENDGQARAEYAAQYNLHS